jgi:hypothetical protein
MPSAAELKAQLLAKRETERLEQERRDAEMALELEKLEQQEEDERLAREAEEQRLRDEQERWEREAEAQREAEARRVEETTEELRLATNDDRQWMLSMLRARNQKELIFHGTQVTMGVVGAPEASGRMDPSQDGDCWPCRVREIVCERPR